jgi:hypothetical protein
MKNNKSLALVKAAPETKPPLTRAEIIEATARAMFVENQKHVAHVGEMRSAIIKRRDAKIMDYVCERPDQLRMSNAWNDGKFLKVSLELFVVPRVVIQSEEEEEAKLPGVCFKTVEDIRKELRAADAQCRDRVTELVKDEEIAKRLVKAGTDLLRAALAKQPSIEA